MRVLTVGNMYPPHHLGGYELIWEALVLHLRARGHAVRVLTTDFRRDGAVDSDPDVRRELRWYWSDHEWPPTTLRERLRIERHNSTIFEANLREFGPAAIAWMAMGGMSLSLIERGRGRGLGSVAVVCDDWMLYGPERDAWSATFRGPRRLAAAPAARLTGVPTRLDLAAAGPALFPSEILRRRALERWRLAQTQVVHQGVDRETFAPAPVKPWGWRLLYAGRIDPRKGIDAAILALTMLPDEATLTVLGGGDESHLEELRELTRREALDERVQFGVATRQELAREYAAADALLFPVRWLEPWGLVPLEAMAVGTPVVASGRGGSGEYLRDGENCLLFDVDEGAPPLAAAVRRLAGDADLRSMLRERGLETVAGIDPNAFHEAAEEMLLAAGGGPS